jgi:hypothetical protein
MAGRLISLAEDVLGGINIVKCINLAARIDHRELIHPSFQRLILAAKWTGVE